MLIVCFACLVVLRCGDVGRIAPRGVLGGGPGARGENYLVRGSNGRIVYLGGKNTVLAQAGDRIRIITPGGGGYGTPSP